MTFSAFCHGQQNPGVLCYSRDYLAIQESSVPCELAFSSAGLTDDKRRNRLLPEDIQTVKGKYVKERREKHHVGEAKRAAERHRWTEDSYEQVQKLKESTSGGEKYFYCFISCIRVLNRVGRDRPSANMFDYDP